MKAEDIQWLREHLHYMYVSVKLQPGDLQRIFDIYNDITGEKKAPTSCGACLRNTLAIIRKKYEESIV